MRARLAFPGMGSPSAGARSSPIGGEPQARPMGGRHPGRTAHDERRGPARTCK